MTYRPARPAVSALDMQFVMFIFLCVFTDVTQIKTTHSLVTFGEGRKEVVPHAGLCILGRNIFSKMDQKRANADWSFSGNSSIRPLEKGAKKKKRKKYRTGGGGGEGGLVKKTNFLGFFFAPFYLIGKPSKLLYFLGRLLPFRLPIYEEAFLPDILIF